METEIPRLSPVWEHSLTTFLGHAHTPEAGMALRHRVHCQGVHKLIGSSQLGSRGTHNQQIYSQDDQWQYIHLRTNQIKQKCVCS